MLPLELRKYLFDIQQACLHLVAFTEGKSASDYASSVMLRSAVERQFEIIGEALSQMIKKDPSLAAHITDDKRIIAFRNRLIHGYADTDNDVVWGIVEKNLPLLQREVESLLSDENEG